MSDIYSDMKINAMEAELELKENTEMKKGLVPHQVPFTDDHPYMKPFTLGWKREVVMRIITDVKRPSCDIYYFHPDGRKFRSLTEVKTNLTDGLTIECFSFKKEPLYVEAESIRNAKIRGRIKQKQPVQKSARVKADREAKTPPKEKSPAPQRKNESKRQSIIRKKEQLKATINAKKIKQAKLVAEKNTKSKKNSAVKKTNKSNLKTAIKTPLKKKGRKPKNAVKEVKEKGKSKERGKHSTNEEKAIPDIKTIVQKNIGKYREMRKRQMLGRLDEYIQSSKKEGKTIKRHRSEPITDKIHIYMKPLDRGWKRELVHRVNGAGSSGQSDVYYFHPNGKKLRSCREVSENLTHDLSLENFTFRKEALGCGEPMEVIRDARSNLSQIKEKPSKIRHKKK